MSRPPSQHQARAWSAVLGSGGGAAALQPSAASASSGVASSSHEGGAQRSQPAQATSSADMQTQLLAMEKKMKGLLQDGDPRDPALTALRHQMRQQYEALLLSDFDYAREVDVEIRLWKFCFYKQIEDYRRLLRTGSSSSSSQASDSHLRSFRAFLLSASGFYSSLLTKVCALFSLDNVLIGLDRLSFQGVFPRPPPPSSSPQRGLETCHRCLVFMGDLARYHEQHSDSQEKSYALARAAYEQALRLLPDYGDPHNQLAVVVTYTGDHVCAAYHYVRSLLTVQPHTKAADNLARLCDEMKTMIGQKKHADAREWLQLVRFALCLPAAPGVDLDAAAGLALLAGKLRGSRENFFPDHFLLRLVVMSMYAVYKATDGAPAEPPSSSPSLVRFFSVLALAVEATEELRGFEEENELLAAVKVACDWLRVRSMLWRSSALRSHGVWPRLVELVNRLQAAISTPSRMAPAQLRGPPVDLRTWVQHEPLPEDRELRGLLPLRDAEHLHQVHAALNTPSALTRLDEDALRIRCLLAFGHWLASAEQNDGDGKWEKDMAMSNAPGASALAPQQAIVHIIGESSSARFVLGPAPSAAVATGAQRPVAMDSASSGSLSISTTVVKGQGGRGASYASPGAAAAAAPLLHALSRSSANAGNDGGILSDRNPTLPVPHSASSSSSSSLSVAPSASSVAAATTDFVSRTVSTARSETNSTGIPTAGHAASSAWPMPAQPVSSLTQPVPSRFLASLPESSHSSSPGMGSSASIAALSKLGVQSAPSSLLSSSSSYSSSFSSEPLFPSSAINPSQMPLPNYSPSPYPSSLSYPLHPPGLASLPPGLSLPPPSSSTISSTHLSSTSLASSYSASAPLAAGTTTLADASAIDDEFSDHVVLFRRDPPPPPPALNPLAAANPWSLSPSISTTTPTTPTPALAAITSVADPSLSAALNTVRFDPGLFPISAFPPTPPSLPDASLPASSTIWPPAHESHAAPASKSWSAWDGWQGPSQGGSASSAAANLFPLWNAPASTIMSVPSYQPPPASQAPFLGALSSWPGGAYSGGGSGGGSAAGVGGGIAGLGGEGGAAMNAPFGFSGLDSGSTSTWPAPPPAPSGLLLPPTLNPFLQRQ